MSTSVYPYLAPSILKVREDESTVSPPCLVTTPDIQTDARELAWLLESLQETLAALKSGLEECYALLAPIEPGSTLVLSSPRSESVKGHVTRVGDMIVKGTLRLNLRTLPTSPLTLALSPLHSLSLPPLTSLRSLLNQSLDCVDITRWTGDRHSASFISSQFRLLHSLLLEALVLLQGPTSPTTSMGFVEMEHGKGHGRDVHSRPGSGTATPTPEPKKAKDNTWHLSPPSPTTFTPPLPSTLSLSLLPTPQSTLLLTLRVLEPTSIQPNLGSRFAFAIGAQRRLEHDEMDDVFMYRGEEVRVREKVECESAADPVLLVLCAKLGALERGVAERRRGLGVILGEAEDGDEL